MKPSGKNNREQVYFAPASLLYSGNFGIQGGDILMYEIKKISDLRFFASKGNATVVLDVHPITRAKQKCFGKLKRDGIYINEAAVVNGKRQIVTCRESLPRALSHIQNIKLGNRLMAERKQGKLIGTAGGVYLITKYQEQKKEKRKS